MEDSVAVNITVAEGLLWCAIKGNRVSAVYIKGRIRTLPLFIRELQNERNLKEKSSFSCIGLHLSNRSKVIGIASGTAGPVLAGPLFGL